MTDTNSLGGSFRVKAFSQLFGNGDLSKRSVESDAKHSASSFSARGQDNNDLNITDGKIDEEGSDNETPTMPKRRVTDLSDDEIMGKDDTKNIQENALFVGDNDEEMKTPDGTMNVELDCSIMSNPLHNSEKIKQGSSPLSGAMYSPNLSPENECGLQLCNLPDQTPPDTPIFKVDKDRSLYSNSKVDPVNDNNI